MSDNKTPLDKSQVHAGDTVTIVVADDKHPPIHVTGEVYAGFSDHLAVGPHLLSRISIVLTDHQPAPEPLGPGTAVVGGVRVAGFVTQVGNLFFIDGHGHQQSTDNFSDFLPDEPRPLLTRDRVFNAMDASALPDLEAVTAATDVTMALLRGES
jgi:hypothetical protein